MTDRIKIGVIGPGLIFRKRHLPALKKLSDLFEISAVLWRRTRPDDLAAEGIFCTSDERDFFARGNFEAIDICTPIASHRRHILQGIQEKKWLLVEKPVVGSREDLIPLESLPQSAQERVLVAENYRFLSSLNELKKKIETIGETPLYLSFQNFQNYDDRNLFARTAWRLEPEHEGGILLDGGIHQVSVLRWFFGDIDVRSKVLRSVTGRFGPSDTCHLEFRTWKGTPGSFKISYGLLDPDPWIIKVYLKDQSLFGSKTELLHLTAGGARTVRFEEDQDIVNEFRHFHEMIRKGIRPCYPLSEALSDVRTALHFFSQNVAC